MTQDDTQDNNEESHPEPQPPAVATFTITASKQTTVTFRGPLPPPEILQAYNKAVPNGADRIMGMAERQSAHRQELEKTVLKSNTSVQKFGVFSALAITLTALVLGFILIIYDKDILGFTLMIGSLGSLVGTFVYGRRSQERERAEKLKPFRDED